MTLPSNARLAGTAYLVYIASTNWSSPMTWVIWFPLLVFELTFAAVLLANRLAPTEVPT